MEQIRATGQSHLILCSKSAFDGQKPRSGVSFRRIRNSFPDFSMSKSLLTLGFVGLKALRHGARARKNFSESPKNSQKSNLDAIALPLCRNFFQRFFG
jgi:hypothetical protein